MDSSAHMSLPMPAVHIGVDDDTSSNASASTAEEDWMGYYASGGGSDSTPSSTYEEAEIEMGMWDVNAMDTGGLLGGFKPGTPLGSDSGSMSDDSDSTAAWPADGGWERDGSDGSGTEGEMSDAPPVVAGFAPHLVGAAPGPSGGARVAKRPRTAAAAGAFATAVAAPTGAVKGVRPPSKSELLGVALQWVKDTNAQGHILRKAMPAEYAEFLLREPSFSPGPRPAIFSIERGQWIFKESVESDNQNGEARRTMSRDATAPASDRWHNSGGAKNSRDLPVQDPQVRRRYGAVEPRHVPGKGFVYHEYVLLNHEVAKPGEKVPDDRRVILYHVMPKRVTSGARKGPKVDPAAPTAAARQHVQPLPVPQMPAQQAANPGPPLPQLPPQPQMPPRVQHQAAPPEVQLPARPAEYSPASSATEIEMTELPMHEMNNDVESVRAGAPIMTLRAPAGAQSATFIRFEKSKQLLGSIKEDGRGVKLSSAGGDIAEWHRVADKPGSTPRLGEGDIIGITNGELSRTTKGADMLGVITRKAMVAGSQPQDDERDQYDTVAYVGRVPVRVTGVVNSGDRIGPSGKDDGTAVAVTRGEAFVGTVLKGDTYTKERFVEISVATPGLSVREKVHTSSWFVRMAVLVLLATVSMIAVWLRLQLEHEPGAGGVDSSAAPAADVAEPPVDCSPKTFMSMNHACNLGELASPSDCGAECTRLAGGMIQNCVSNLTRWPNLGTRQDPTADEAYTADLAPLMVAQSREAEDQLSPLSGGICYLGGGSSCFVMFNVSALRGHQLVGLDLKVAKYAATTMDSPFAMGKERMPVQYVAKRDDITVELASTGWGLGMDKPSYGRLLNKVSGVGSVGRLHMPIPLDAIELEKQDLLAVRLSSSSDVERRYAGLGLPDRWASAEEMALYVVVDPVDPEKFAEGQRIIHDRYTVNGFMAAMCIMDDTLGLGQGRASEILDGPQSCPGVYRGLSNDLLKTAKQTQCSELGEGVTWPACCAGGAYDACTYAPRDGAGSSPSEMCGACPVGSMGEPSTYECYAVPQDDEDECTSALDTLNRACSSRASDELQVSATLSATQSASPLVFPSPVSGCGSHDCTLLPPQNKCDMYDGFPGCYAAVLNAAALAETGRCEGVKDRCVGFSFYEAAPLLSFTASARSSRC